MILIDTHAHLDFPDFQQDLDEVLKRAKLAGVEYIINIATDRQSLSKTIQLIENYPFIFAAAGIHPHEADKYNSDDVAFVEKFASHPKVVAVGEVGLDFYRKYADHDHQRDLFRQMIGIAKAVEKPLVIHNRAANEETLRILKEEGGDKLSGVFHCFAGDEDFARQVLKMGFFISYTGSITFPNSRLPQVAKSIPIERVLLETDCPFLAPQNRRGKRCEPADVATIALFVAGIKGLTLEDIARITTYNAYRLFGVGPVPESAIVYPIRDSLYVNLTNRCTCECVFCPRSRRPVVKGHHLKLEKEPDYEQIVSAINGQPDKYRELVFCGFGEPTMRLELLLKIAEHFRPRFPRIRLDTNGHGNLINGRNIISQIATAVDAVSVSLNTSDPEAYLRLNRPQFGRETYNEVINFIRGCKSAGLDVTATVVGFPDADIEGAHKFTEKLGVNFRVRKYNDLG